MAVQRADRDPNYGVVLILGLVVMTMPWLIHVVQWQFVLFTVIASYAPWIYWARSVVASTASGSSKPPMNLVLWLYCFLFTSLGAQLRFAAELTVLSLSTGTPLFGGAISITISLFSVSLISAVLAASVTTQLLTNHSFAKRKRLFVCLLVLSGLTLPVLLMIGYLLSFPGYSANPYPTPVLVWYVSQGIGYWCAFGGIRIGGEKS